MFRVFVGAVHSDSSVSVVSFDINGTLKQKVGIPLLASADQPLKCDFTSRESSKFWLLTVSVCDPAAKRQLFGSYCTVVSICVEKLRKKNYEKKHRAR